LWVFGRQPIRCPLVSKVLDAAKKSQHQPTQNREILQVVKFGAFSVAIVKEPPDTEAEDQNRRTVGLIAGFFVRFFPKTIAKSLGFT
jgi:hypothetical protein